MDSGATENGAFHLRADEGNVEGLEIQEHESRVPELRTGISASGSD